MSSPHNEIWLVRHGQTEWSLSGQHTGSRTDIPLTSLGARLAEPLRPYLTSRPKPFALILSSPLIRATETARIAGFPSPSLEPRLMEWDYGDLEGQTSRQIQSQYPGWSIWEGPWPGGETKDDVQSRCKEVIQRCQEVDGDVLIFAHGHLLRALTGTFLGLGAQEGRLFRLDVASVSRLGYEHGRPAVRSWNRTFETEDDKRTGPEAVASP